MTVYAHAEIFNRECPYDLFENGMIVIVDNDYDAVARTYGDGLPHVLLCNAFAVRRYPVSFRILSWGEVDEVWHRFVEASSMSTLRRVSICYHEMVIANADDLAILRMML